MKTKKAVVGTAKSKELQSGTYHKLIQLSSFKMLIGELLLFGNKERKEFWCLFEVLLRQYLKSHTEYASERPRRTRMDKLGAT